VTVWGEFKKKHGINKPWHIAEAFKIAEQTLADQRYAVCVQCPDFVQITKQCKRCGCFMPLKTKLENSKCPVEKW
jgi:hypothetical protein